MLHEAIKLINTVLTGMADDRCKERLSIAVDLINRCLPHDSKYVQFMPSDPRYRTTSIERMREAFKILSANYAMGPGICMPEEESVKLLSLLRDA